MVLHERIVHVLELHTCVPGGVLKCDAIGRVAKVLVNCELPIAAVRQRTKLGKWSLRSAVSAFFLR